MEHFGEKGELCGHIYFNTGIHHEERGELHEAYENYKRSYLICREVFGINQPFITQILLNVLTFS